MEEQKTIIYSLVKLQSALKNYDDWKAKEEIMRAEADRTGDRRAYMEWLRNS
ncbi:hypothetical protein H0W91_01945 [Patescibacteria group bacterium]|nr:hypothetical protein [Patescibacteria group bacterium]